MAGKRKSGKNQDVKIDAGLTACVYVNGDQQETRQPDTPTHTHIEALLTEAEQLSILNSRVAALDARLLESERQLAREQRSSAKLRNLLESILSGSIFRELQISNYNPARVDPGSAEYNDLLARALDISRLTGTTVTMNLVRESTKDYICNLLKTYALRAIVEPFSHNKTDLGNFLIAAAQLLGIKYIDPREQMPAHNILCRLFPNWELSTSDDGRSVVANEVKY